MSRHAHTRSVEAREALGTARRGAEKGREEDKQHSTARVVARGAREEEAMGVKEADGDEVFPRQRAVKSHGQRRSLRGAASSRIDDSTRREGHDGQHARPSAHDTPTVNPWTLAEQRDEDVEEEEDRTVRRGTWRRTVKSATTTTTSTTITTSRRLHARARRTTTTTTPAQHQSSHARRAAPQILPNRAWTPARLLLIRGALVAGRATIRRTPRPRAPARSQRRLLARALTDDAAAAASTFAGRFRFSCPQPSAQRLPAMPPKKAAAASAAAAPAAAKKASASAPAHASYSDMVKDAIVKLKERNGSSRQAIQKYIKANNDLGTPSDVAFKGHVNRAIAAGVEKGDFLRPKGASGTVKLAKKEAKPAAASKKSEAKAEKKSPEKKAAAPKKAAASTTSAKKATPKKAAGAKTSTAATATTKATPKKAAAAKANASKPRKTAPAAPAVEDEVSRVLGKTKSGRVTKTKAPASPKAAKKAGPKKTAGKKATPKKATPKKA